MYFMDSKSDRPDFDFLQRYVKGKCSKGIKVCTSMSDSPLAKEAKLLSEEAARVLAVEYGISNPRSTDQVIGFMRRLNSPLVDEYCMDSSGKYSSAASNLSALAMHNVAWAIQLLKFRRNNSLLTGMQSVLSAVCEDGCIHPSVSLQKTNRISYYEPALMNIDKRILWDLILPLKEGNCLWAVDVKNQEPWILAHVTGDETLMSLVHDCYKSGESFYKRIYSEVYGDKLEDVAYAEMKTSWNSLNYGASIRSLRAECRVLDVDKLYEFFKSLSGVDVYRKKVYKAASQDIRICRTLFASRLDAGDVTGNKLKRTLLDLPIQGTGADILALLVSHFEKEKSSRGITEEINLYFTRHDEVIFEVSREWQDSAGKDVVEAELRDLMEHQINDWLPFGLEVSQLN